MNAWWESLDIALKILYCIAIPSTLVLVLQTILSASGFGDGPDVNISDTSGFDTDFDTDFDVDFNTSTDVDVDFDADVNSGLDTDLNHVVPNFNSLKLFTVQGLLSFFAVFSWMAIVLCSIGVPAIASVIIGVMVGFMAMYAVAWIAKTMKGLAENGTIDFRNAIGENAVVYIPIPANAQGEGKVTLTLQGRFMECDAITIQNMMLKTGQNVRVIDLRGDILVVEQED